MDKFTPAVSSKSAAPLLLLTERLPCFATRPPAAATTTLAMVDTLNKFDSSPPDAHH